MHPRSTPDPTDADAVFARVMAEQPDAVAPARPSADPVLAKAPDVAGPRVPEPKHAAVGGDGEGGKGGPDGKDVEDGVAGYLDYLSQLAQQLGVPDPVEEYFAPVVGRWSELHNEAERWRSAAKIADESTESLTKPLGSLDSAWRGKDADAFVQYMGKMGLAGNDLSDAMGGMAKALDKTANGIREIVQQMAGTLADTAESSSQAMTMPAKGDNRVRAHLDEARRPTKELFDSVRQILEAFVKLCDGIDGGTSFDKIQMKHTFPEQNFPFPDQVTSPKAKHDTGTHASGTDDDKSAGGSSGGSGRHAAVGGGGGGGGGGSAGGGGGGAASGGAGHSEMTPAEKPQPGGYVSADEKAGGSGQQAAAASAGTGAGGGVGGQGQGQRGGAGGMPMMGGMGGGGQGGDQEHKRSARVVGDPTDIFGRPTKTSPSVIGEEE